jgi:fructose-bisphosphate aldolase class II
MLVPFVDLLADALAGGYAVGYFEAWDMYSLEAVLEAAEAERAPVILGFGGAVVNQEWLDRGGLERWAGLGRVTASQAGVPVSYILNEVSEFSHVVRGIHAGFNCVMLDSSELPAGEHKRLTNQVVELAHPLGVGVEAEVGMLPDASGDMGGTAGALTDPREAKRFVEQTGIDALGVSIGNVHTLMDGKVSVDWERLEAIHQELTLPLVIHGGTGFPDDAVARAISLGVAQFNVGACLKQAFLDGLAEAVSNRPPGGSIHQLMGSRTPADVLQYAKDRMKEEVARRIRLMRPGLTSRN